MFSHGRLHRLRSRLTRRLNANLKPVQVRDADFGTIRRVRHRVGDWLRLNMAFDRVRPRRKLVSKISLIVPCYNIDRYVDDFLSSLFTQTVDPTSIEIVAVDDGSTDYTAERLKAWSKRLPNIKYIHQENRGLAAARNVGLEAATGDWISFPDPDDFLSRNYLERVDKELLRSRPRPLVFVSCNLILYRESMGRTFNRHPLRYRFWQARKVVPADDLQGFMQLAVNNVFLRRADIEEFRLRFDRRVVPSFEDGHFINKLLLRKPEAEVVFLRGPVYYYRRRASEDSLLDRSKQDKRWYLDQLRYGVLDLLADARATRGEVPEFVQRVALYQLFWRVQFGLAEPTRLQETLTESDQEAFWNLFRSASDCIEERTIDAFDLSVVAEKHKVGLLSLMKDASRPVTRIYARKYDPAGGLLQLDFFSRDPEPAPLVQVDGRETAPADFNPRVFALLGHACYTKHDFVVPIREAGSRLSVQLHGNACSIMVGHHDLGMAPTLDDVLGALS